MEYQDCALTIFAGQPNEKTSSYKQIVKKSVTVDDLLQMLSDPKKAQDVINDWHYGQDLRSKANLRSSMISDTPDPVKSFEKSVKEFMKLRAANGKPISEEKAREIVKLMQDSD